MVGITALIGIMAALCGAGCEAEQAGERGANDFDEAVGRESGVQRMTGRPRKLCTRATWIVAAWAI
jgi:hypothetical protein